MIMACKPMIGRVVEIRHSLSGAGQVRQGDCRAGNGGLILFSQNRRGRNGTAGLWQREQPLYEVVATFHGFVVKREDIPKGSPSPIRLGPVQESNERRRRHAARSDSTEAMKSAS